MLFAVLKFMFLCEKDTFDTNCKEVLFGKHVQKIMTHFEMSVFYENFLFPTLYIYIYI